MISHVISNAAILAVGAFVFLATFIGIIFVFAFFVSFINAIIKAFTGDKK